MSVNSARFVNEGNEIMRRSSKGSANTADLRFRSHFGISAAICADLWCRTGGAAIVGAKPMHLLWGLMLLKLYCSTSVLCSLAGGVHEQTFKKWAWTFVKGISELQYSVVSFYWAFQCSQWFVANS